MAVIDGKRLGIAEVSDMTGVPAHILRQWETRFPPLKPRRDRANRRFYSTADVDIIRRIKHLLWVEKLTTEGARKRLAQELKGEGRPKTRQQAIELLEKIEAEARAALALLDDE